MSYGDILKQVNEVIFKMEKYRNLQEQLIIHKNHTKTLPKFKTQIYI